MHRFLANDGTPTSATSSAVGNPYCWHGLRLDSETGLQNNDGGGYFEPQTGRKIAPRNIEPYRLRVTGPTRFGGNNPWSPEVCDHPGDDAGTPVTVTITSSAGTSQSVTGGR